MRDLVACLLLALAITTPANAQDQLLPMGSHSISRSNWSFECVYWNDGCGLTGSWITTKSQPGAVRLWQSGTEWAFLHTGYGGYDWKHLDIWLDLIAAHQPTAVIYTFGLVPCWISSARCDGEGWGNGHNFSPTPPSDLTPYGSAAFTQFVSALVQYCSPAGNCVKDYVKYWEMWNEGNLTHYWTGSATQLYDMFKPVIPIIRQNVPGAVILTPPVCGGDAPWMARWLNLENTKGRLSDYYSIHLYMRNYSPEQRLSVLQLMLNTKNVNGWITTPWVNTETGYDNVTLACSTYYKLEDCAGQLVRWHVLQYAFQGGGGGAFHVGWYGWDSISKGGYDTYYYTMMRWLTGASFTESCTKQGDVWTCPLRESSGTLGLIVWNGAGYSVYKPAMQYVDYRYFNDTYGGATKRISPGQSIEIGLVPVMFESGK